MKLQDTDIQGVASVSRNLNVGHKLTVGGDAVMKHNLRVEGWLDAPNVKGPLKGLFDSAAALALAYPNPRPGWMALVGNGLPADLYVCRNGKWVATGERAGELEVSLDSVDGRMSDLEERHIADRDALDGRMSSLEDKHTADTEAMDGRVSGLEEYRNEMATRLQIIGDYVELADLDSFGIDYALAGRMGMRLIRGTSNIGGVLFVTGDAWGHCIIETVIGNYSLDGDSEAIEGTRLTDAHRDGDVSMFTRTYYGGNSSADAEHQRRWSTWRRLDLRETAAMLAQLESGLADETEARQRAVDSINRLIGNEAQTRNREIARVEGLVEKEAADRETAVQAEALARETAIQEEASARETAIQEEILAREAAVEAEKVAREAADEAEKEARTVAIAKEAAMRVTVDENLGNRIDALDEACTEAILNEETAREEAIKAETAAREEALKAEADARIEADEGQDAKILEIQRTLWPIVVGLTVAPTVIETGVATSVRASWTATCRGANILPESVIMWNSPAPGVGYPAGSNMSNRTVELTPAAPQDYTFTIEIQYNGMKTSASRAVKAVYPSYFGVVDTASPTAAQVKALGKLLLATRATTQRGIALSDRRICFAYPQSFGTLASVKDGNNFETLTAYTRTALTIDGVAYHCYVMAEPVTASGVTQIYS